MAESSRGHSVGPGQVIMPRSLMENLQFAMASFECIQTRG
jgi:hypothetical protein